MNRYKERKKLGQSIVDSEAAQMIQLHGDKAYRLARDAGRLAQAKGDRKLARYYGRIALAIARHGYAGFETDEP